MISLSYLNPEDVTPDEMYALSKLIRDLPGGELKDFLTYLLDELDEGHVVCLMTDGDDEGGHDT